MQSVVLLLLPTIVNISLTISTVWHVLGTVYPNFYLTFSNNLVINSLCKFISNY